MAKKFSCRNLFEDRLYLSICRGVPEAETSALPDKCEIVLTPCSYLQVRSPTGVHGKAASGALHEAMSSPDTSGSTPERSHSNAATAKGERVPARVGEVSGSPTKSDVTYPIFTPSLPHLALSVPIQANATTYLCKLVCRNDKSSAGLNRGQGRTDLKRVEVSGLDEKGLGTVPEQKLTRCCDEGPEIRHFC